MVRGHRHGVGERDAGPRHDVGNALFQRRRRADRNIIFNSQKICRMLFANCLWLELQFVVPD